MARGKLRIFLGAVAGVGKTYAMLGEAWRRRNRGIDVVIGFVEPHGRAETAEQIRDLEVIPPKQIEYRGTALEEMDVDAVLARRPEVALVDELAHTNVPGSRNAKRWQDVAELLDAGIDVVSTLNVQHLESLNDVVEDITGVKQKETIPDEFVRQADEIQLVEMTPEALRRLLAHGDIYPPDRSDPAMGKFFRPGNLVALRELALMWVADRGDDDLHDYAGDIDVHVVSAPANESPTVLPRPSLLVVSPRRRWVALAFSLVALPLLTGVLLRLSPPLELSGVLLLYLTVTVVATAIGGGLVAIPTGVAAVAIADFYFTEPYRTFIIADAEVVIAIVVFAVVTALVSWLVDRAARQAREARRAGAEAAALARITSMLTSSEQPLPALVDDLVRTFGLVGAAVLRRTDDGWQPDAAAGANPPRIPGEETDVIPISSDHVLAVTGRHPPGDDRRVLASYAGQLAVALAAQRLEQEIAEASLEADSSRLRAALLSSVSHDLRTPLSTIKAYASSLLQHDVAWRPEDVDDFATSIVEEADRLNGLIGNLLDMSRLETDDVSLRLQPVGLEDLVPAVLHTLPYRHAPIVVDLPDHTPAVWADPRLLERIVTNLIDNALRWSPVGRQVLVRSAADGVDRIRLEVVDHGPGIEPEDRERVFHPFQRLGDRAAAGQGVGLGLAVARGFARAMGGDVHLEATPGGGTTAVVDLAVAPAPVAPQHKALPS